MSIVGASAGSGFDGEIIFGNAPATEAPSESAAATSRGVSHSVARSAADRFVQAMAAFGADGGGAAEMAPPTQPRSELLLGASLGRRDMAAYA